MNFKCFIKGMILFIPLLLSSCNDEESTSLENKCKIICSVDEFESANPSRTNADPNDFSSITWASGDVIGIFPREGYQEPFEIPIDQIGKKSASFDGGYWDVKDGLQYNAYYPFDKRNFDSAEMKTRIPVTYIGQQQNGSSCDIGAFDYTYSDWNTATNGSIGFDFHHIGAIGVFSLKYPATTTYTKMTLSVDDALIPLEGCYDLTANDVSMIPDENSLSTSIDLKLTNCSGVAGETGVFYMMLPPMDLSTKEVTLSLTSAVGTTCTYSIEKAMNVKKGKLYRRTGIPIESKVEGTVDGWIEEDLIPYVTFSASARKGFMMSKAVDGLEYSVNEGEWSVLGTEYVEFGGSKGNLRLRGKNSKGTAESSSSYSQFKFDSSNTSIICTGDIRTLVDYDNYSTANTSSAKFCYLFSQNAKLVSAPELPATVLAEDCYYGMFSACFDLALAPNLPAKTLSKNCYRNMFQACISLTSAPELPAETLAEGCYSGMFNQCEFTSAPELPATTLVKNCYSGMFMNCINLISAPDLYAATLVEDCYYGMFAGCEKLNKVTMLAIDIKAPYCLLEWLHGVSSTGTFTKAASMTTLPQGSDGIPTGWTVISK